MENKEKKNSNAKIKANNKYRNAHYKSISVMILPEKAEEIKVTAKAEGKSLAQYIIDIHSEHKEHNNI